MSKEDIVGGLRNAISHGENIQKAASSFLNAGYDKKEVEEAIQTLTSKPKEAPGKLPELPAKKAKKAPKLKSRKKIIGGIVGISIAMLILLIFLIYLLI